MNEEELIGFEQDVADLFEEGKIKAPVHLSRGNEKQLIEIFKNVKSEDWVFSTHRNHYHALLHGVPPKEIKKQILNKNSITLNSVKHRFLTSAILGGIIPLAVGTALGLKRSNSSSHVWVFVGDMAGEMGIFCEAVKYAQGHDLPITFVVEDNGKSVETTTKEVWGKKHISKVVRYSYKSELPHQGIGKWVMF